MSRIYPHLLQEPLFLIWCSHPQDSPSQPSFPVPSPAATLGELPLSASEYFHLLLSRVPLVSSFMVHRCHTCCSSLGHCAIPNSVSNLHIRIYEADLADHTMSATTIHQEDGDGKSSKDSSNCWLSLEIKKGTKCITNIRLLGYFVNMWPPIRTHVRSGVLGISSMPGFKNRCCSWVLFVLAVSVTMTT